MGGEEAVLQGKFFPFMQGIYIHVMESQREAKPLLHNRSPFPFSSRRLFEGMGLQIKKPKRSKE